MSEEKKEERKDETEQPARKPAMKPVSPDGKEKVSETTLANKEYIDRYAKMSFKEKLQLEIENLEAGRPVVIFKKIVNPKTKNQPRNVPTEVPFVFYLDGPHGVVARISEYRMKGWPIVYYGQLWAPDKSSRGRLQEVSDWLKTYAPDAVVGKTSKRRVVEEEDLDGGDEE